MLIGNDFVFKPDIEALKTRLKIDEDFEDEFQEVFDNCARVARPVYALMECDVRFEGELTYIGDVEFESALLKRNLAGLKRVYPHIITCGRELYELALSTDDPLARYWVDCFAEQALFCAGKYALEKAKALSGAAELYNMGPGSLKEFPITAQKPLFSIFGDTMKLIGVELTETCLMLPYKSASGLYFESDKEFISCSMCPRENCPNRRAPYDEMQGVLINN